MSKRFQTALLLCPEKYSLFNSLMDILKNLAQEAAGFDIRGCIRPLDRRIHAQIYRFPFSVRSRWEKHLLGRTNALLLAEIRKRRPDLVLVYNSEFLLPETCAEIRKDARLVFFMGDSPFYTPQNNYYLACLPYADLVLSPDSFWSEQLRTMGISKTAFFAPGIDLSSYHVLPGSGGLNSEDDRDVLYTGTCYADSWGYKKAYLMSRFARFNFRLYGNPMWKRWFRFFPELEKNYIESGYIPTELLNRMFNRTRLIPVDGNPGILNGFHLRLFEALGSGALPLVEYRKDVKETLFKGCPASAPLIMDYKKAGDLAEYYLKKEYERKDLVTTLRDFVLKRYSAEQNSAYLSELLRQ